MSGWQPGPGDWPVDGAGVPPSGQPSQSDDGSFAPGGDGSYSDSAASANAPGSWGGHAAPSPSSSSYGQAPTPFAGTSPYSQSGQAETNPYAQSVPGTGQPMTPDPYGQPAAGYGQQPGAGGVMPSPVGQGGPGPMGPGGGYPPQGPGAPSYGYGYGMPPKKNKNAIWFIVGGALLLALLVSLGIFFATRGGDGPTPTPGTTPGGGPTPSPSPSVVGQEGEYGSDPELDALWDSCQADDMQACDDLRYEAEYGTGYYEFATSCGEREDEYFYGKCVLRSVQAYGDDTAMDALWDACSEGDWAACDDLTTETNSDSEYYEFGRTCGETEDEYNSGCEAIHFFTYGDDPELDELYDWCKEGDMGACDDLYRAAAYGTDYEHFGQTCGTTRPNTYGSCDEDGNDQYGEDRTFDALWDSCQAGEMWDCYQLEMLSPYGSEYYEFGETCGDTVHDGSGCVDFGEGVYGSETHLDGYWDQCGAGDMEACDTLYELAPSGSEYYEFGNSCGDTTSNGYGMCSW